MSLLLTLNILHILFSVSIANLEQVNPGWEAYVGFVKHTWWSVLRKYLTTSSDTFGNISFKFSKNSFSGNTFTDYTDLLTNLSINSKYKITKWNCGVISSRIRESSLIVWYFWVCLLWETQSRGSVLQKVFLKTFARLPGKHLYGSLFYVNILDSVRESFFEKFDRPN